MKTKLTLLLLYVLSNSILSASVFQKKSSITMKDGKEVTGYIKFFPYRYTPNAIDFCEEEFGTYIRFTAKDIRGFRFENERYISANTQFFEIATNREKLKTDPKPTLSDSTIFLETILEGEKNLYVYKSSTFRFYYMSNGVIKPYIFNFFLKRGEQNETFLFENIEYKNQLNHNLGCNLDIQSKPKSDYTKHFFKELYNRCYQQSETYPTYEGNERKNQINLSVIAGISHSFSTDINTEFQKSSFSSKSFFTPGIAVSWRSKNKKFSFINELIYLGKGSETYYHLNFRNDEYFSDKDVSATYNNIVVWNSYLHFPIQIAKNEFFLNLGLNLTSCTGGETYVDVYDQFYTQINADYSYTTNSFALEGGYLVGLGYAKNQFKFELRLSPVTHTTEYYFSKPISRFSLVCSYDLLKEY